MARVRTGAAMLLLIAIVGCGGGGGGTPVSQQCSDAMTALANVPDTVTPSGAADPTGGAEQVTLTSCKSAAEWKAAAKTHPELFGTSTDLDFVLRNYCGNSGLSGGSACP